MLSVEQSLKYLVPHYMHAGAQEEVARGVKAGWSFLRCIVYLQCSALDEQSYRQLVYP